jgi:hypothetical protein
MIQPVSPPQDSTTAGGRAVPAIAVIAAAAALAGALALWAHYGTAVFFEMIVSGLEACF